MPRLRHRIGKIEDQRIRDALKPLSRDEQTRILWRAVAAAGVPLPEGDPFQMCGEERRRYAAQLRTLRGTPELDRRFRAELLRIILTTAPDRSHTILPAVPQL